MAGKALNPETVRTEVNWAGVMSALLLGVSVFVAGAGAYRDNWIAVAAAGVFALAGIGMVLLATLGDRP